MHVQKFYPQPQHIEQDRLLGVCRKAKEARTGVPDGSRSCSTHSGLQLVVEKVVKLLCMMEYVDSSMGLLPSTAFTDLAVQTPEFQEDIWHDETLLA